MDSERMEILELEKHPYFVAVQFHPEYLSRPMSPSPPFLGLVLAAKDKLKSFLARGCKLSPRKQSDSGEFFIEPSKALSGDIQNGGREAPVNELSNNLKLLKNDSCRSELSKRSCLTL